MPAYYNEHNRFAAQWLRLDEAVLTAPFVLVTWLLLLPALKFE